MLSSALQSVRGYCCHGQSELLYFRRVMIRHLTTFTLLRLVHSRLNFAHKSFPSYTARTSPTGPTSPLILTIFMISYVQRFLWFYFFVLLRCDAFVRTNCRAIAMMTVCLLLACIVIMLCTLAPILVYSLDSPLFWAP